MYEVSPSSRRSLSPSIQIRISPPCGWSILSPSMLLRTVSRVSAKAAGAASARTRARAVHLGIRRSSRSGGNEGRSLAVPFGLDKAIRSFLLPDVEQLLDLGHDLSCVIQDRDLEGRLDLPLRVGGGADLGDPLGRDMEGRPDGTPPRPAEADGCGLVPHDVAAPERLGQDQHEERVAHRIERAAELGPHVVAIEAAEL